MRPLSAAANIYYGLKIFFMIRAWNLTKMSDIVKINTIHMRKKQKLIRTESFDTFVIHHVYAGLLSYLILIKFSSHPVVMVTLLGLKTEYTGRIKSMPWLLDRNHLSIVT